MTTVLLFAGGIVLLVVAAELFTNAIEWAGFRMRLASGATGSLLAALGTSLPEFVVPVVALAALTRRMGSWSPCRTRTGWCRSRSFGPCQGAPT